MTIETLRRTIQSRPFKPFNLNLTDGRSIHVRHPEFVAISGGGRIIAVFDEPDAGEFIDLLHVVSIEEQRSKTKRNGH
ncbi:MAG TPA: hypothetical protein VHQ47_03695 [Phycisphaerae bacterium]|nr:hypothetical protein [Phycisphaerae bacterium]